MVASPRLPFWNLRPFSTEVTRTDSELRLIEREVGVLRILRDLGVAQPPHRAVGDHDRAKALESRAAERVVLRKQEVAAPESFARHRAVRLSVDGQNDAGCALRLRDALYDHQDVPVGVPCRRRRASISRSRKAAPSCT